MKICIQLWLSSESTLLYIAEQVFVNTLVEIS